MEQCIPLYPNLKHYYTLYFLQNNYKNSVVNWPLYEKSLLGNQGLCLRARKPKKNLPHFNGLCIKYLSSGGGGSSDV